ncbi:MAG: DoxX family protein [Vicinamibacteraceae bacterium]|nr:DoxX family protein [Vicinamibacteraceae bacterium]
MQAFGPLVLRLVVGAVFIAHGLSKLVPVFGQSGLAGATAWFESLGLQPAYLLAAATGLVETVGGLLLVLGAFTPLAAAALSVVMIVAIWTVHAPHGFFINWTLAPDAGHGVEFNAVLLAALASLLLTGPGSLSFDEWRRRDREAARYGRQRLRGV